MIGGMDKTALLLWRRHNNEYFVHASSKLIEENFDDSQALDLQRRLVNSIKGRKPERFAKGVQIVKESKNENK